MRSILVKASVVALMAYGPLAGATSYKLDESHTSVGFKVKHLVVASVKGSFNKFDGAFEFDEAKGELSKVEVNIDTASIDTNDAKRDDHLKSPDFFDASKNKKITFKGNKVEYKDKKPVKITGDLQMKGVTKPITLDVEYNGAAKDPWGNEKVGFSLKGKLNRKDWNITWNKNLDGGGVVVGEEVEITIDGEANKVAKK